MNPEDYAPDFDYSGEYNEPDNMESGYYEVISPETQKLIDRC